jgi:hypothetical protein
MDGGNPLWMLRGPVFDLRQKAFVGWHLFFALMRNGSNRTPAEHYTPSHFAYEARIVGQRRD